MSGRVLPQLPASMRRIWQGVAPGVATPLGLAVVQRIERKMDLPFSGGVRVDVQVERPKTMSPGVERKKEPR